MALWCPSFSSINMITLNINGNKSDFGGTFSSFINKKTQHEWIINLIQGAHLHHKVSLKAGIHGRQYPWKQDDKLKENKTL